MQLLYLILGSITALTLFTSVVVEWRHHRPVQTIYGLVLLLLMAGLFYIHTIGTKLEGAKEIVKGVWWGGNYDQLKFLIELRFINDYFFLNTIK